MAMRYAGLAAKANGAGIAVLHVLEEMEFQHWGDIEERMKAEQRAEAEKFLQGVQDEILGVSGIHAKVIIEEGKKSDAVLKAIANDPNITKLILAGSTNSDGPGPLIEYFAGKGIEQLQVPLTIVPGHLSPVKIETLV